MTSELSTPPGFFSALSEDAFSPATLLLSTTLLASVECVVVRKEDSEYDSDSGHVITPAYEAVSLYTLAESLPVLTLRFPEGVNLSHLATSLNDAKKAHYASVFALVEPCGADVVMSARFAQAAQAIEVDMHRHSVTLLRSQQQPPIFHHHVDSAEATQALAQNILALHSRKLK